MTESPGRCRSPWEPARGNVVPTPTVLSKRSPGPPCNPTSSRTRQGRSRCLRGRGPSRPGRDETARISGGARSSGIPIPVSATSRNMDSRVRPCAPRSAPRGVNLNAFAIRFGTIFSHRLRSTHARVPRAVGSRSSGARGLGDGRVEHAGELGRELRRCQIGATRACVRPAWKREKSSSALTSLSSRSELLVGELDSVLCAAPSGSPRRPRHPPAARASASEGCGIHG